LKDDESENDSFRGSSQEKRFHKKTHQEGRNYCVDLQKVKSHLEEDIIENIEKTQDNKSERQMKKENTKKKPKKV